MQCEHGYRKNISMYYYTKGSSVCKTPNTMESPFMKRFVFAPLIFLIVVRFISFFVHVIEIDESMYYILIALMSVPLVLYMLIG
jgi:hypothetical protein